MRRASVIKARRSLGALLALSWVALGPRSAVAREGPYDLVRDLARSLVFVENEYVDPVERSRLLEGAVKGMVSGLDPHSEYLTPEDFKIFESDTKGEFGGVGVEVDLRNDAVIVIAPIEGSPAERAGVQSGDRIVAIDGEPVRGKSMQELVRRMRGKPGSRVVVSITRGDDGAVRHLTLTREVIQVSSVLGKMLDRGVLYLRIKQFQWGTYDELLDTVGKLRADAGGRFAGVLLDLRNNPGGLVDEASATADAFLTRGIVYTTRHRARTVDEVRARPGGALSREPVVVLVNEYSASAAELLAGALQDHHRATVVGALTFGKGSVQTIVELPGGSGLRLTTMRYYTPGGHGIQANGIRPDVQVEPGATSYWIVRESDLENHLPGEGAAPRTTKTVTPTPGDQKAPDLHLGVAKDVPKDPTRGKDHALSIGFQILTGTFER